MIMYILCVRNEALKKAGLAFPKAPVKTGTTIVGIVFKDGVILGADTRATEVRGKILLCLIRKVIFSFPYN